MFQIRIRILVSSKIQQCQLELQQTTEASHTLQGELVVKRLKLADLEVNAKLLTIRRGIAQEQRDKLAESRKQVIDELVCLLLFNYSMYLYISSLGESDLISIIRTHNTRTGSC